MYRKNFHEYLENIQNPDDLSYIYGQQKNEILNKLQAKKAANSIIQKAAFSIAVTELQKALKI